MNGSAKNAQHRGHLAERQSRPAGSSWLTPHGAGSAGPPGLRLLKFPRCRPICTQRRSQR